MPHAAPKAYRSVLYVPASNQRALTKIASLACDAVILDLEDAVAPGEKLAARENLKSWFDQRPDTKAELVIRVNPMSSDWGTDDLALAGSLEPHGILIPKADTPRAILEIGDALDDEAVPDDVKLWAMIETPRAMLNIGAIAELGRDPASRLAGLVAGTNDLAKETGVGARPYLLPWLMQIVLAARAGGLIALDGVMNDFNDHEAFERECSEAAAMGFDGKTLIHPSQVEPVNRAFSPSVAAVAEARQIVDAFGRPENADKGVLAIDGRMVERLHLVQAERLIARSKS